jgi:hypothetical protein
VELAWTGALHRHWLRGAPEVHAMHLPSRPWDGALGDQVLGVLRQGLDLDFLVLPAACPTDRLELSQFMAVLEGLLEVTAGRGLKLALRPLPGHAPALVKLLKEARGEAVGYCWDAHVGSGLDSISDRLFCAVGAPTDPFAPLQRLGYRWNLALPGQDPAGFQEVVRRLEEAYPPVLFPAELEPPTPQERP